MIKERYKLEIDYRFDEKSYEKLRNRLLDIKINPYHEYHAFMDEIEKILEESILPKDFIELCDYAKSRNKAEKPFIFISNCPIDNDLPVFDWENPVESKHKLKKTFVGEGFLLLWATIMKTPALRYVNVNNGDIVQDIYPQRNIRFSQSQKAMAPIGFHKDLANHFVKPDYVNILSMRSFDGNDIQTTFVRNIDIINLVLGQYPGHKKIKFYATCFACSSIA